MQLDGAAVGFTTISIRVSGNNKRQRSVGSIKGLTPKSENLIKHPRATVSGIQPETGSPILLDSYFHYNI